MSRDYGIIKKVFVGLIALTMTSMAFAGSFIHAASPIFDALNPELIRVEVLEVAFMISVLVLVSRLFRAYQGEVQSRV